MELLILILSGLSIFIGIVALLIGSFGLIRLPDVFCRIHAVGMIDTAGASFIILGMVIYEGFTLVTVKLLFVGIFLFFTSPIATHAVAQVAHTMGLNLLAAISRSGLSRKQQQIIDWVKGNNNDKSDH